MANPKEAPKRNPITTEDQKIIPNNWKNNWKSLVASALFAISSAVVPDRQASPSSVDDEILNGQRQRRISLVVDQRGDIFSRISLPESSRSEEQQRNLGAFVELPSIGTFTEEEQNRIQALVSDRFSNATTGRYLIPIANESELSFLLSDESPFAQYIHKIMQIRRSIEGEVQLLLLIQKENSQKENSVKQVSIIFQPMGSLSLGERMVNPENPTWIFPGKDGGLRVIDAGNLPQGASLDAITRRRDLLILQRTARAQGYEIDLSSYNGGFVPVIRDEKGRVIRVFGEEGPVTFEQPHIRHTGGDPVNIRDNPSTSGNRVGSFTSTGEPLRVITPEEFQKYREAIPDQTRLSIENNRVTYNDGRYTWIAVSYEGKIRWVAQFPQIQPFSQLEGVSIRQEAIKESFSNNPNILARQLRLPEGQYNFYTNEDYGPIEMLRDQNGKIWAVKKEGQANWQTAEMVARELGLDTHGTIEIPGLVIQRREEKLYYYFYSDLLNLFLIEERPSGNRRGIVAMFDHETGDWLNFQYAQYRMIGVQNLGIVNNPPLGIGYSRAAERFFSLYGVGGGVREVDIWISPELHITKILRVYWLENPGPRTPWTLENLAMRTTVIVLDGTFNGQQIQVYDSEISEVEKYLQTVGVLIRSRINIDPRSEKNFPKTTLSIWDFMGRGERLNLPWEEYQRRLNDFYRQHGVMFVQLERIDTRENPYYPGHFRFQVVPFPPAFPPHPIYPEDPK